MNRKTLFPSTYQESLAQQHQCWNWEDLSLWHYICINLSKALYYKSKSSNKNSTDLLKSFSVSRASSPWPRRSRCLSSISSCMIFSKSWFKAWFEWVTISVLCAGKLWYRLEMIWTATSVFPVPGGPTTNVRPGCIPARIASTWVGVNGIAFLYE